jgi:hypothetical protein
MKYFWKANIYEIQSLLFWILGFLIIHFGDWKWVGWLCIVYGFMTMIYTFYFIAKNYKEFEDLFRN